MRIAEYHIYGVQGFDVLLGIEEPPRAHQLKVELLLCVPVFPDGIKQSLCKQSQDGTEHECRNRYPLHEVRGNGWNRVAIHAVSLSQDFQNATAR